MGRLEKVVKTKKEKIIHTLISESVYQPADRFYLTNLPLRNVEDSLLLFKQRCQISENDSFQLVFHPYPKIGMFFCKIFSDA